MAQSPMSMQNMHGMAHMPHLTQQQQHLHHPSDAYTAFAAQSPHLSLQPNMPRKRQHSETTDIIAMQSVPGQSAAQGAMGPPGMSVVGAGASGGLSTYTTDLLANDARDFDLSGAGIGVGVGVNMDQPQTQSAPSSPPPKAKKSRVNVPWTPAEELLLKTMRDAGNSWSDIAKVSRCMQRAPHRSISGGQRNSELTPSIHSAGIPTAHRR